MAKLRQYFTENTSRFTQPGLKFLKAVRVFDPMQAKILAIDSVYEGIPECASRKAEIEGELAAYKEAVLETADGVTPICFWFSQKERFPILSQIAVRYLSVPSNSVDAERSVSQYNLVNTENRQRFEEPNLVSHSLLVINSKK